MTETFYIKQNDRAPSIFWQTSPVLDLTGLAAVFSMRDADGTVKVNRQTATVADGTYTIDGVETAYTPTDGVLFYDWASGDTDTAGVFYAEFEVTVSAGVTVTFPNNTNIVVQITDDIA